MSIREEFKFVTSSMFYDAAVNKNSNLSHTDSLFNIL